MLKPSILHCWWHKLLYPIPLKEHPFSRVGDGRYRHHLDLSSILSNFNLVLFEIPIMLIIPCSVLLIIIVHILLLLWLHVHLRWYHIIELAVPVPRLHDAPTIQSSLSLNLSHLDPPFFLIIIWIELLLLLLLRISKHLIRIYYFLLLLLILIRIPHILTTLSYIRLGLNCCLPRVRTCPHFMNYN